MQRTSQEYQTRKLAWELCQSPQWSNFLLPLLEGMAAEDVPEVDSLDNAFRASKKQGSRSAAKFIIARVKNKAEQFKKTRVEISEEVL